MINRNSTITCLNHVGRKVETLEASDSNFVKETHTQILFLKSSKKIILFLLSPTAP